MNRVKRAIIIAAGMGDRLRPITYTMPKPLISVNGRRMIETIIEGLHKNDIREIYVVVGYLKEQFECIREKYPEIVFIENPYFATCNNISSLYVAREHLSDVIIMDADQLVNDPSILSPEFLRSGYNAVYTNGDTKEWLMQIDSKGVVSSCSRVGGVGGWILYSVSRWSAEDGKKLRELIEYEFNVRKNRSIYWDDVAMFCHPEKFELGIREMKKGDIVEIDTLEELIEIDPSYAERADN